MVTRLIRTFAPPHLVAIALLAAVLVPGAEEAGAYQYDVENGNATRWRAASPASIWDDASQTLTWHFNQINFPQPTWPSVAQAGAAFQNGYKTLTDVPGTSLKVARGADVNATPLNNDGRLDLMFALDETNDPFTQNISGAFAVTYVRTDGNGNLTDADIVMNGDTASFPRWSTDFPPPNNSNDVETTACHEQIHSIGGGHPVYFYAMVWPTGRVPELLQYDRCISPDDRILVRTLYPGVPALRTITGKVLLSSGGTCNLGVVVATDGNGVPQATRVTASDGTYSINVPSGSGYTITAHHHSITDYAPSDIAFGAASDFYDAPTTAAIDVSAGNAVAPDLTVQFGPLGMKITGIAKNGGAMGTQVLFAGQGSSGVMHVEITGQQFSAVSGDTASLGPGVTIGNVTATAGAGLSTVSIPYTVAANAAPGVRNLSFTLLSGQKCFGPSYFEVLDNSTTLTVSASAGNPSAGAAALGLQDVALLGFTLTAGAVEDVRVRRLRFNLSGSGSQMPNVKLWVDNGTLGTKDVADVPILSGDAYVTPGAISETIPAGPTGTVTFDDLAVTIPAGQSVNFLFTGDMPASGNSTYTVDLNGSAANITAHGMYYGTNIAATGAAAGNTHDAGALAIASLNQIRTTAGTVIPVGGSTNETQVTIQAVVTSSLGGTVGMEVEVQPISTPFTNVATGSVTGLTSPAAASVLINPPLTNLTSYHWQARPTSSATTPGPWVSFGANVETAPDFSCDNSTTNVPSALAQFEKDGVTPVLLGALVKGRIVFSATNGTNSAGGQVRLEIEVRPDTVAFTGTPNVFSAFGPSGGAATASFAGATNTYHWQARTSNQFGTASGWVDFNATTPHFDFKRSSGGGGGGCIGTVAVDDGGAAGRWGLVALALLIAVVCLDRKPRRMEQL